MDIDFPLCTRTYQKRLSRSSVEWFHFIKFIKKIEAVLKSTILQLSFALNLLVKFALKSG